jgi:hypothetical protein
MRTLRDRRAGIPSEGYTWMKLDVMRSQSWKTNEFFQGTIANAKGPVLREERASKHESTKNTISYARAKTTWKKLASLK